MAPREAGTEVQRRQHQGLFRRHDQTDHDRRGQEFCRRLYRLRVIRRHRQSPQHPCLGVVSGNDEDAVLRSAGGRALNR